jgi:enolase
VITRRYGKDRLYSGGSAGYGVPASDPEEVLDTLLAAAEAAGYGGQCRVGLDCAATHFYSALSGTKEANTGAELESSTYRLMGKLLVRDELIAMLAALARKYDLFFIEDPLDENDFEGFAEITRRIPTLIVGDDLLVSNLERLKQAVNLGAANAMLLKPNMIGTISEAMAAARYAQSHGYTVIGSGRAGGTVDDPITDIAVAVGAPLVKFGAPRSGERLAKHNCVLRFEEELGAAARFAGLQMAQSESRGTQRSR